MTSTGFTADGHAPGSSEVGTDGSWYNTQAQNVTDHPALSVPAGVAANGVPFGLQITGPRFRDDLVLAVGEAWQAAHPSRGVAPGYEVFWED
jgi:Asp-tRNA(Asn)/Glu-tRNA(Gln) amidotransferase A subunit family amidase